MVTQAAPDKTMRELQSIRDTVESVWVAIILAFVLRAFLVEAFVIPTGSMAPRLMGQHVELVCPSCGYAYSYGISGGVTSNEFKPVGAACPNCGKPYDDEKVFLRGGDRVLVLKYPFRLHALGVNEPKPWDVVVFRNPQNNRENYIKRLIGLPGETIEIVHGDIFVSRDGSPPTIRRKPPRAQAAMWQVVFDNDYQPSPNWRKDGWPPIWEQIGAWELGEGGREFIFKGSSPATLKLEAARSHFLPEYGYNGPSRGQEGMTQSFYNREIDVCSDLKLAATFFPKTNDSRLTLGIVSFGQYHFRGRVSADGTASISYSPDGRTWESWGNGHIEKLSLNQGVNVALTNVDFRLTLWVDDKPVLSSADDKYPQTYTSLKNRVYGADVKDIPLPQVRLVVDGGACHLRHVRVYRDVYYTSPTLRNNPPPGPLGRLGRDVDACSTDPGWGTTGHPITLATFPDHPELDQFFVLGDNSPESLDGRMWVSAAPTLTLTEDGKTVYQLGTVPRYSLIGRAMFVYWPGGFRLPIISRLPLIPNVGRMRLIR